MKPRIRRVPRTGIVPGYWVCSDGKTEGGAAATPLDAYSSWFARRHLTWIDPRNRTSRPTGSPIVVIPGAP